MGEPENNQQLNWNKIGFFLLAILILISIAFTAITYTRIESIDKALELESEGHYLEVRKNIEKSVVLVLSYPAHNSNGTTNEVYLDDNGRLNSLGTGFSINDRGDILTAYHVIRDAEEVKIEYDTGTSFKWIHAEVLLTDPDHDLAILRINSSIPPLTLQSGDIQDVESKIGSYIGYSGYIKTNYGLSKITVRGSVSGKTPIIYHNLPVYAYVLGATANHGNSGGPVFSLKTGEVIGIINTGHVGIEGITFSTAINQDLINNMYSQMPKS